MNDNGPTEGVVEMLQRIGVSEMVSLDDGLDFIVRRGPLRFDKTLGHAE